MMDIHWGGKAFFHIQKSIDIEDTNQFFHPLISLILPIIQVMRATQDDGHDILLDQDLTNFLNATMSFIQVNTQS